MLQDLEALTTAWAREFRIYWRLVI